MTCCYLGLGSNLAMPMRQLHHAITALRTLPRTIIVAQSSVYLSNPLGVRAQPCYYNMVIAVHTSLSAIQLLHLCHSIENKQKRLRKIRWGARTLDIDLLLYGNESIHTQALTIPHPQMLSRDFVLIPLLEIAPQATLPDGTLAKTYLASCKSHIFPIND